MSQETENRDSMERFAKGEAITDAELAELLHFFGKTQIMLEELVEHFNPSYGFALSDVRQNHERLKMYTRSRKEARAEERKVLGSKL